MLFEFASIEIFPQTWSKKCKGVYQKHITRDLTRLRPRPGESRIKAAHFLLSAKICEHVSAKQSIRTLPHTQPLHRALLGTLWGLCNQGVAIRDGRIRPESNIVRVNLVLGRFLWSGFRLNNNSDFLSGTFVLLRISSKTLKYYFEIRVFRYVKNMKTNFEICVC